ALLLPTTKVPPPKAAVDKAADTFLCRYVLPKDLPHALKQLDDSELVSLLGAAACILLGKIAIDWLTAAIGLVSLAVLFRWKISNPLLIGATAVVGVIAFPLLQPAWGMGKYRRGLSGQATQVNRTFVGRGAGARRAARGGS